MSITSGTGTSSPSEAPRFGPFLQWNSCNAIFSVHVTFFCLSILLLLDIVWSVPLRFKESDYHFVFFKFSNYKDI